MGRRLKAATLLLVVALIVAAALGRMVPAALASPAAVLLLGCVGAGIVALAPHEPERKEEARVADDLPPPSEQGQA